MRGQSILITGASGFTGQHACHHFQRLGMKVTALVHEASSPLGLKELSIVNCNLLDTQAVADVLRLVQPSYVLHLGGINSVPTSWQQPLHTFQVNVIGTLNVMEALRSLPTARALVVTSKLKDDMTHPYACSKAVQEMATLAWSRLFHLDIVLAEPSNLIGPGPSTGICALLAQQVVQQERGNDDSCVKLSSRNVVRDYLDVRDAVAAYEKLLFHAAAGRVYAVRSGTVRSLGDVADTYGVLAQAKVSFHWQAEQTIEPELPAKAEKEPALTAADTMPAEWGWHPTISFQQSLADCLHYFRNGEESIW